MEQVAEVATQALRLISSQDSQESMQDREKSAAATEKRSLTPEEIRTILQGIGIPLRFIEAKKEDIDAFTWEKTADYRQGLKEGLFIHGKAGTGKTHIAAALIRARVSKLKVRGNIEDASADMVFVSLVDLLLEIKACFREGSEITEERIIDKYTTGSPFLTIDDLGTEKSTEWVLQTLHTIIDRRYRNMQKTVITSNLDLDGIAAKIGDRIASRIIGMCKVIELKGKDRRLKFST